MALQIIDDIAGVTITEDGFSLIDSLGKQRDLGLLTLSNVWFAPGNTGAILQPVCTTSGWSAQAGKWAFADWASLDPAKWETISRRQAGDYYLQSKGLASGVLQSAASVAANTPLFVEFQCFAQPGQAIRDYLIVQFGQNFRLHVHSNGTADLEDLRQTPSQIVAEGFPLTSSGADLAGKFVQIFILPWRRGRIYFWTNQGGAQEIFTGARKDGSDSLKAARTPGEPVYYVTTEAAHVVLTPSPATRAFLTANPYTGNARFGSAQSPVLTLPRPVTSGPLVATFGSEQQDGTSVTLTITYFDNGGNQIAGPDVNTPAYQAQYTLTLSSPDTRRTPQVFGANVRWERGLGARQYQTNLIGSPNAASFQMSRDRSQKSFAFELDNPHNKWTSLKDLENRKVLAQFIADNVDTTGQVIFSGYTDAPEFLDGQASRIKIPCSGLRKFLKSSLMSDAQSYDGMTHCAAVLAILHDAGFDPPSVVAFEDGVTFETAPPGEDPYWRPANGTSRDEFIQHICDTFSGYVFDDIGGVFYYVPAEYFTAAALAGTGVVPVVYTQTPMDPGIPQRPAPAAIGPNAAVMVALRDSIRETLIPLVANDIWVLGFDPNAQQIVAAHYEDFDSIHNRLTANYVGERRTFIYASACITSVYMAYQGCAVLARKLPQPLKRIAFSLQDFQANTLPVEGPLYLEGFGLGLITSFSANLDNDRWRETEYTMEVL